MPKKSKKLLHMKIAAKAEAAKASTAKAEQDSVPNRRLALPAELIELVLSFLPCDVLVNSAQLVCRQWRDHVAQMPNSFLPDANTACKLHRPVLRFANPLLRKHFDPLFHGDDRPNDLLITLPGHDWEAFQKKLRDMTIAQTTTKRAVHDVFARRGVSWRRMQLCWPPLCELRYETVGDDGEKRTEIVRAETGIRMGQFYDLVIEIATHPREDGYDVARVTWPLMDFRGCCPHVGLEDYANSQGVNQCMHGCYAGKRPVSSQEERIDYLKVERMVLREPENHSHRCWYTAKCGQCFYSQRQFPFARRAKYLRSVKWVFRCADGGARNLIVGL